MTRIFILLATSFLTAQTAHVAEVDGSAVSKPIEFSQDGRRIRIEMKDVQGRISAPSGTASVVEVLALYDPHSKLFWWTHQYGDQAHPGELARRFLAESVVYLSSTELVAFRGGLFLRITPSSQPYPSLRDGLLHVFTVLDERRTKMEQEWADGSILVNLGKVLSPSFIHLRNSSAPFPLPKLRTVTRSGNQWRIVLDGPNGDSAIVTLNEKYAATRSEVVAPEQAR